MAYSCTAVRATTADDPRSSLELDMAEEWQGTQRSATLSATIAALLPTSFHVVGGCACVDLCTLNARPLASVPMQRSRFDAKLSRSSSTGPPNSARVLSSLCETLSEDGFDREERWRCGGGGRVSLSSFCGSSTGPPNSARVLSSLCETLSEDGCDREERWRCGGGGRVSLSSFLRILVALAHLANSVVVRNTLSILSSICNMS